MATFRCKLTRLHGVSFWDNHFTTMSFTIRGSFFFTFEDFNECGSTLSWFWKSHRTCFRFSNHRICFKRSIFVFFLFQRFQVFSTLSFFGWSEQLLNSDCSHFSGFSTPVQVQPKTSTWFIFAAVPVWVSSRSGDSREQNKTGCGRKDGEFRSRSRLPSSKWRSLDTREC